MQLNKNGGIVMKKLLVLVMALAFCAGSAFAAGEVNVKLGLDPFGDFKIEIGNQSQSESTKFGFNLSAEYLYPVHDIVRVGGGLEYLFDREVNNSDGRGKVSMMPVYATVLVNPIEQVKELYFKGNLGFNAVYNVKTDGEEADVDGGFYWALGAGYELENGLLFEVMYGVYYASMEEKDYGVEADYTYSKLGINIGYKFKM